MLDLSYLGRSGDPTGAGASTPPTLVPARDSAALDLDQGYARYVARLRAQDPQALPMSADQFARYSLGANWLAGVREVAKRLVQTCRLMVGVHDYEYYLDHMRTRHPQAAPLTREAFYRYCLEARYPSAQGGGSRCPC
jgi:uncharacterized short protein YbdD (DUF466 family)